MRRDARRGAVAVAAVVVAAAALASVVAGTAKARPAVAATRYLDPVFAVGVQRDVVYGTARRWDGATVTLLLDLYTPRNDTATDRPVFVFAHGGAFVAGSKEEATQWPIRMAQRGYVAASINYRLGPVLVTAPVDTPEERAAVDDARADMQAAVRWFRANAEVLRIDPERIAVGGFSAGAITALGVALGADDPLPGDHEDQPSGVCTAVSIAGANDVLAAGPDDAGAILHHGGLDGVVPVASARATADAMAAAGLPVLWNELAGEGHAFSSSANAAIVGPTVQWLYDRVATAPYPCSAAVRLQPPVAAGRVTPVHGPADRSAVVSLVAVDNRGPGYVQALPCGVVPGGSSNLNVDAPRQIRATLAVVRFDADGRACLYNQPRTHLVADIQGAFAPGAFDDVDDERLLDTRTGSKPPSFGTRVLVGRPDATGVVSLVMTETSAPGWVQVLPCDAVPGGSSNLNADAAGQTRAGLAFVRFDGDGRACVFTQRSTHLVADLQGYVAAGAVDDVVDERLLDTRTTAMPASGSTTVVHGRPGSTGVVSIVATESTGPGYVQVLACGDQPGGSSNLNTDAPGQTVAVLAFVRFAADGTACVFTQRATHLVVDLQAYMAPGAFDDLVDARLLDTRRR